MGLVFLEGDGDEDDLVAIGTKLIDMDVKAIAWKYADQDLSKMDTMEIFELFQDLIHEGIRYKIQLLTPQEEV